MHAGRHLAGLFTSLLCLLAGLWLLLGAWVLGLVPSTGAWPGTVVLNVATGAGVTLAAVVALILYGRTLTADLAEVAASSDPLPLRRRRARRLRAVAARPTADTAPDAPVLSSSPATRSAASAPAVAEVAPRRDNVEELLLPIASALLSDVVRRRGGSPKTAGEEEANQ